MRPTIRVQVTIKLDLAQILFGVAAIIAALT